MSALVTLLALSAALAPGASETGECHVPCRVGGDLDASVVAERGEDGETTWRSGSCAVRSPLPIGYPRPTPPGALEIKRYPVVRRAETAMSGGSGRSAFWPLFEHIRDRGIAMTAPVELDYEGLRPGDSEQPAAATMAFLYRRTDMAPTGEHGRVVVSDAAARTVLSLGQRGTYSWKNTEKALAQLGEWLAASSEWEADGDARVLRYNGPSMIPWNKWSEIQVPVRPASGR